jgi:hypothetical protein
MFRQEEFEKMLAAGIIKPEELPKLADGFILHFCWHPAPNRFQPGLAIDQLPLPP